MSERAIRPAELIRRTHQALSAHYAATSVSDAPTIPQLSVLEALKRHGPQTGVKLMALIGMDRSTLHHLVTRMRQAELLAAVRVNNTGPRQGPKPMAVSVTPKGLKALKNAENALWIAEVKVMKNLTPAQRAAFLNALNITAFSGPRP